MTRHPASGRTATRSTLTCTPGTDCTPTCRCNLARVMATRPGYRQAPWVGPVMYALTVSAA